MKHIMIDKYNLILDKKNYNYTVWILRASF